MANFVQGEWDWLRGVGNGMQQSQSVPMALPQMAQNIPQNPNALQRFSGALRNLGQEIRANSMSSSATTPSAVQEYVYFSNLPPEEQQNYLRVKRAQQVIDLGGTQGVLNPAAPGLSQQFDKTLPPHMVPENVQERTAAGARGKVAGETAGTQDKKLANAPDILGLIAEARKVLPEATSGGAATMAKGVSQFFGSSTDASKVDRQLKIIGSALTNYVPRFEGPQSDYDVQTYKDAAGDVANTTLPYEDRLAALDTIETLQKKYTGSTPAADGNTGGKIRVMNPQTGEAFDIDQGDLQAAQAEGFVPQ
jgi:hypothetical protein